MHRICRKRSHVDVIQNRSTTIASTPVITLLEGAPNTITITSTTPLALIYYTLDGTLPDNTDILYTGPFTFVGSIIVRAIATRADLIDSSVATLTFEVDPGPPPVGQCWLIDSAGNYVLTDLGAFILREC